MKRNILSLAVGAALVAGVSSASSLTLQKTNPHANQQVAVDATFEKDRFRHAINLGEGKVRVIFQLEDAPTALFPAVNPAVNAQAKGKVVGDIDFSSQAAKEYKAFLNQKQNLVISSAKQIDSTLKADIRFDTLTNGFAAVVDKSKLQQLSKLAGVKAVYPDTLMHATMDRSLDVVNAPEVWEMLGGYPEAGKGVKVAIIDSGLRPENPLFSGEGFEAPDDVPTDDYCATVDASFCNGKVIAARAAEIPEGFSVVEEEFMSPMAFNGHGTHVAGTAAGNWGVEATRGDLTATISGVAPAAYLMIYKGLYATPANPASSSGSNSMLVSMLEASVADGADIVNNSWGGGSAVVAPFYEEIFVAAKAAGSTMVFAAGNDGPGSGTIGSPGTSGEVLTVGGSTTDRFTANFFSLAGSDVQNTLALTAGPVAVSEDITLPIVYAGSVDEANFEGCTAWENTEAFTGAMALISRGSCTFNDKIVFAQDAGASGVIIFNNQPDAGPIGMAVDDSLLTVPAAMIGTNAGLATVEALGADAEAMATLTASVGVEDSMYNASSRGANADPEVFKPNLIAPGVQIFSGESPVAPGHEGENFSLKNGTSMASPHVAGAAALIKQMNPDWSAEQIMSAVTSTAVRDTLVSEDLESTPDAFDYGAGRLDIYRAANAQLTFSELGLATNDCFLSCEWTLEVTNTADSDISVTVDSMIGQGYELSVSPADATLTAGSTTELTITVDTTNGQAFDTWVFGGIEWNDGNSETPEYFIPIAVNAVETEAPGFLSTSASQTVVEAGESVTLGASIDNIAILEPITLNAEFGEGFVLDADGVSATINGEAQTVTVDSDAGTASWTGTLGAADFSITPDTKPADDLAVFGVPGYFPVSALLGTAPLECSSSCDDTFITVDLDTPIPYLGDEYTTMHVSSNGFVVLGDDATGANFSLTQPLPSTDAPNNVIAPLWMDLDLDGGDGVGGGTVSVATNMNLNDFGCGPACGNYVVVEWQDAEIYQVEGEVYSFQLWLDKDTGDSYFYYGAVGSFPAMLNQFGLGMTVGAENETGQVGITQARIESDNTLTGTLPAAGDIWKLSVGAGESLEFSAAGSLAERDELIGDNVELTEDGTASFDVLANDVVEPIINTITVSSGMQSARAFKTLNYDFADFDASSLAISTAPMNGTAEVVEGSVQYTPVADYNGADSFEYSVMDDGEMYTATVNVNVTPVNDAPVINAINVPATTVEGGFVTVSVDASDIDGDNLTVTINGNEGASASLLAPQVSRDGGSLDITVTVSDGIETVTQTTAVTVNDAPKGSGSMAWYSLLLLPLTWLRRRKQA